MVEGYPNRLGNFWFPKLILLAWLALGVMAVYFFQTLIHEGSHAMAGAAATGNSPTLAPFPHESAGGNFLNGVTFIPTAGAEPTMIRKVCDSPTKSAAFKTGFIGMPQMVDLMIITLLFLVFFFAPISNPMIRFPFVLWYLGATIDFCYNTIRGLIGGCNAIADWSRVMLEGDISPALFAILTWVLWIVFVFSHFLWVYYSQWGKTPAEDVEFWDFRWLGLIFGALSLICIIWSQTVSDPRIIKESAGFIVPLFLHIVAMTLNFLFFGLSFKYRKS
jgi:hypothetical protein